jgi:Tfp pilus assembly protein PilE
MDPVKKMRGVTIVEFLLVGLIVAFLIMIIINAYNDAVRSERRSFAHRGLLTVAGLQERWFARTYQYAQAIEQVGGADIGGEYYHFQITQDPCGNDSCYTAVARFSSVKAKDPECERFTINNHGLKKAYDYANKDNTELCWKLD